MRTDRLTDKSQEALQEALSIATRSGHPELLPEQFLVSVLSQPDAVGALLVERASGSVEKLVQALSERLEKLPRVSGGAEPRMSPRMIALLQGGEDEAKKLKDDFV